MCFFRSFSLWCHCVRQDQRCSRTGTNIFEYFHFSQNCFFFSVFGKTCENTRAYTDVKIITGLQHVRKVQRFVNSPLYERVIIYNSEHVGIVRRKQKVILNKPRYVGAAILGISKVIMNEFHYDFMKVNFPSLKVGFSDTDSFLYHLTYQGDIYEKLKLLDPQERWFDFSNYPVNHPNYSLTNKLVPGRFKDEGAGTPFIEGVFLRSKMYSLRSAPGGKDKSTAKGIARRIKERDLCHQRYLECIQNPGIVKNLTIPRFSMHRHIIKTVRQSKKGLSCYNDKFYISRNNDGYFVRSYGHYELNDDDEAWAIAMLPSSDEEDE